MPQKCGVDEWKKKIRKRKFSDPVILGLERGTIQAGNQFHSVGGIGNEKCGISSWSQLWRITGEGESLNRGKQDVGWTKPV